MNASNRYDMNVLIEDALHKVKRERELERQVDQTLTTRYVSRFEPLALHPRLHHRVGFLIHYRSTELLSQPYKATEAIQPQSTSTEEG